MEAGTQVFFSYSSCVGLLTVLGSYNTYSNNCYKDCFVLCLLNSCTSVVAGFAVFSVLGFMAHEQGKPIEEVAESGPGLAFIAYPQAVAMIPLPQVWAVCFFVMVMLLCLDTEGGMYWFQLFDYYACSGACVLFLSIFQTLTIGWIFGAERLCDIIEDMTGSYPNVIFRVCWKYITPLISLVTLIYYLVDLKPLTYNREYVYPGWAHGLGWMLALSSILVVPGWALGCLWSAKGSFKQRWLHLCSPDRSLPLTRIQRAEIQEVTSSVEMEVMSTPM